ncbi:MAG: hypothetical protein ACLSAF_00290 [Intestinimonas sp.]
METLGFPASGASEPVTAAPGRRNNGGLRRLRRVLRAKVGIDLKPLQTQGFPGNKRRRASRNVSGSPPLFVLFYMQKYE